MELFLLTIGYGLYKTSWSSCCAVPELVLILGCNEVSTIGVVEVACCPRFDQRFMFRLVGRSDHSDRLRRANLLGYREDCLYFAVPVHHYARGSSAVGAGMSMCPYLTCKERMAEQGHSARWKPAEGVRANVSGALSWCFCNPSEPRPTTAALRNADDTVTLFSSHRVSSMTGDDNSRQRVRCVRPRRGK